MLNQNNNTKSDRKRTPIRKELGKKVNQRLRFRGVVIKKTDIIRRGKRRNIMLVRDLIFAETKKNASDHIWITITFSSEMRQLMSGQIFEFDADIRRYGHEETKNYCLLNPSKVKVIYTPKSNQIIFNKFTG